MDSDPDAAGDGGSCPCCSASAAAATWRRSVKRKLEEAEEEEVGVEGVARVEADEEAAALREAAAAAQETAAALRAEVEEERLAAASAASEAMAMMLRLQREKAEVQMELRQFRRFAEEKMAIDADELAHLQLLLARRDQALARARYCLRSYRLQFHHLGIPIPEDDLGDEDLLEDDDGGHYPELRCYDEDYYEEEEEGEAVVMDLERRICRLENDDEKAALPPSVQERSHLYDGDAFLEASVQERRDIYADEACPESPVAGCNEGEGEEEEVESNGNGGGSDRVYTIDTVHQGVEAPAARVSKEFQVEVVEPVIKKLYMRLEALEADRESMRQELVAMRTEKAQLVLLREIAQKLAKDAAPAVNGSGMPSVAIHLAVKQAEGVAGWRVGKDKKKALVRTFSMVTLFKWILALFCCKKKKPSRSRYTFGLSSNNVGLLILLDKSAPSFRKTHSRSK